MTTVLRYCATCRRERPIRDFDLGEGVDGDLSATCRYCAGGRSRAEDLRVREQIAALERQRRTLIASLVKIDSEIATLRGTRSSPFERVDLADVLDSSDGGDRGFGD
jgi:hypothetical protein